jgi:hypothetical protein
MKCAWYVEQLANDNAEMWRNGRPSSAWLDHARECSSCDRTIERELQLKLIFTDLADKSRTAEPSPAVKHNLLAALGTMRPQKRAGLGWIPRFAIAGTAIAFLGLGLLLARRSHPVDSQNHVAKTPAVQPSNVASPAVESRAAIAPRVVASKETAPLAAKTVPHSRQRVAETANDFYPMVMCDSITCAGPAVTVRVELPASSFSGRHKNGSTVMADLLVGEDGVVRGVRLLQ